MNKSISVYIDIVNRCNLRCPSCPVGNVGPQGDKIQYMSLDSFGKILDVVASGADIASVNLYNWSEPFLHPDLSEFIRFVNSKGWFCGVSSNFNIRRNLEQVLDACPAALYVSVSGFSQEIYSTNHVLGNIEKVKKNIIYAANYVQEKSLPVNINIMYHIYRDNLDELKSFSSFARHYNVNIVPYNAHYAPVEKLIRRARERERERELLDKLPFPVNLLPQVLEKVEEKPCALLHDSMVIAYNGDVSLCCATYSTKYNVGNLLYDSYATIQNLRMNHPLCRACKAICGDVYYTRRDELPSPDVR